jgi:multimeric flavodoxin WrbA
MKIVALLGSPRPKGNSALIARKFVDTAQEMGAAVEVYELNKMAFKGCQGCGSCKTKTDYCVVEDDLTPVYDSIKTADVLVLASPVYFGDLSGQLKCWFDRTFAYANPDFTSRLAPGKRSVFILTQGAPAEDMFADIHPRYERWLKMFGFGPNYLIRALGVQGPGEVKDQPEVLAQAEAIAEEMMGG